jgi:hypothetical protein
MKKINVEQMKKEIEEIAAATVVYFDSSEANEDQNHKNLIELEETFLNKYGFDANIAFRLTPNGFALNPVDYVEYVIENGKQF